MEKLNIRCKKHGMFQQKANSHLNGRGCPKCANNQLKNTKQFIKEAINIHQTKYNYSEVIYKSALKKIIIICNKHGNFKQKPVSHLSGQGCPKCGIQLMQKKLSNNQDNFIKKSIKKHNNKYDYSKVVYNSMSSILTIICTTHGQFKQKAKLHLAGHGCPQCAGNQQKTTEQFISEASTRWNNRYTYQNTNYVNNRSKITATCPKHGDFTITAGYHLQDGGCPNCALSSDQYDLLQLVKTLAKNVKSNDRSIITPYEFDILIPSHNLAIEFNGNYYHSYNRLETTEERYRHQFKADLTDEIGIKLLQIT